MSPNAVDFVALLRYNKVGVDSGLRNLAERVPGQFEEVELVNSSVESELGVFGFVNTANRNNAMAGEEHKRRVDNVVGQVLVLFTDKSFLPERGGVNFEFVKLVCCCQDVQQTLLLVPQVLVSGFENQFLFRVLVK